MADKRVSAVVDRQRLEPSGAKDPTRCPKPLTQRVARERLDDATGNQRREKRLVALGADA